MKPDGSIVALNSGNLSAGIDPTLGAALLWLRSRDQTGEDWDWMRPIPDSGGTVLDAACFPLVPFSNRIADAQFAYNGKQVSLKPNWPGNMAIHGVGWQRDWQMLERTESMLSLGLEFVRGDWPWVGKTTLNYELRPNGLSMALRLENLSDECMPSGLGFHPYFPRAEKTGLVVECDAVLTTDTDQLPVGIDRKHIALQHLKSGRLPETGFDNALAGWTGNALIDYGSGRSMRITAAPETGFAVHYAPEGEDFFCFEPVTHIPNAHNLRSGRLGPDGLIDLAPGEVQNFAVDFELLQR